MIYKTVYPEALNEIIRNLVDEITPPIFIILFTLFYLYSKTLYAIDLEKHKNKTVIPV